MSDSANLSVSDIGTGIAGQGRPTDYSKTILAVRSLIGRQSKQPSEKLVNLDDFKLGDSSLYPLFTKKVGEVVQRAANEYKDIESRVGDPIKARNIWELNKNKYQEEINQYRAANDESKRIIQSNPSALYFPQRDKLAQAVNNMYLTGDQWQQTLHNPDQGSYATNTYGIAGDLVPNADMQDIANKFNKTPDIDKSSIKFEPIPGLNGKGYVSYTAKPSDTDLGAFAHNMLDNPDLQKLYERKFRSHVDFQNPDYISPDDAKRRDAKLAEYINFGKQIMTARVRNPELTDAYHPPMGEEAKAWKTEGNKIYNSQNTWMYTKNDAGDEVWTMQKNNASENADMKLVLGKTSTGTTVEIVGTPVRWEKKAGEQAPTLVVDAKVQVPNIPVPNQPGVYLDEQGQLTGNKNHTEVKTQRVPYFAENADRVAGKYGLDPYEVRSRVGGDSGRVTDTHVVGEHSSQSTKTKKAIPGF